MLLNTANNNNIVISNVLGLQKNCIRLTCLVDIAYACIGSREGSREWILLFVVPSSSFIFSVSPLTLLRTDTAYAHRWLQDLRFSFRRLRREGYIAQESASQNGLSDWLLGTSENLKLPTQVSQLELVCAIVHVL